MAPDIALQIAIHDRLIAAPALIALVPAASIKDAGTRPEDFPCIRLGDAQIMREGETRTTRSVRVYSQHRPVRQTCRCRGALA